MAQLSDKQHASIADLVPELDRLAVDAMADWTLRSDSGAGQATHRLNFTCLGLEWVNLRRSGTASPRRM
jgi:hypothetical protein